MTLGRLAASILLALLVLPAALVAQEEPDSTSGRAFLDREGTTLSSDRPGLGDGAHVVGQGVWQAEVGGTIEAATSDEYLVGSPLVRYGLASLEVRLFVPTLFALRGNDALQLGDLGVGVKVPLDLTGGGWRWAATGSLTLPTGSDAVSVRDPALAGALIGERALTDDVGFAFNVGYGFTTDDVDGGTLSLLATPTFPVPGKDDLSFYFGYAGFYRQGDDAHVLEWGLARLDGPDRQWDVNAGYDPGEHTWFLGVGLARRWR